MKNAICLIAASAFMVYAGAAFSQNSQTAEPRNVVQLSASGTVEVQQDLLVLALSTSKEGADAASTQAQLKQALDAALAETKRNAQHGQMDVRTGPFGLYPRYGKDGKINGWQGRAELVLEGRDFARITATAGKIQTMAISQVGFALSREARAKVEGEAQTLAAALNHSAFNAANALGPWLGGLAIAAGHGWTSTGWVGAALALGGLLVWGVALASGGCTSSCYW